MHSGAINEESKRSKAPKLLISTGEGSEGEDFVSCNDEFVGTFATNRRNLAAINNLGHDGPAVPLSTKDS